MLGQNGAINYLADKLGFGPFDFLIYSDFAVNLTLVQLYVLFMVTPVFFQLAAIDTQRRRGREGSRRVAVQGVPRGHPAALAAGRDDRVHLHLRARDGRLRDRPLHRRLDGDVRRQRGEPLLQQRQPAGGRGGRVDPRRRDDGRRRDPAASSRRSATRSRSSPRPRSATAPRTRSASGCSPAHSSCSGIYTLYASWKTLLELAIGIVVVGARAGRALRRARPQAAARARRVLRRLPAAHVRADDRDDAALVPGLAGPDVVPGLGPVLDATGTTSSSTTRRRRRCATRSSSRSSSARSSASSPRCSR